MSIISKLLDSKTTSARLNTIKVFIEIILPILKPVLPLLSFTYIIMLCQIGVSLLIPKFSGNIIDLVTRSKDESELKELCLKMFLIGITFRYLEIFGDKMKNQSFKSLDYCLQSETYRRLLECEMEYFDQKTFQEMEGIHGQIKSWFNRSKALIEAVGSFSASLYVMYQTFPKLMFVAFCSVLVTFTLRYFLLKKANQYSKEWRDLFNKLSKLPNQAIQNILLFKSFSTERKEHKEYMQAQDDLAKCDAKRENNDWFIGTVSGFFNELTVLGLIWYGGILVFQGVITVGELSTFNMYAQKFQTAVFNFKNQVGRILRGENMTSVFESLQIILKNEEKRKCPKGIVKASLEGDIEIKDVSFSYITKLGVGVLSRISLKIDKGQYVAIVGANGSGKTTLSYLMQGLYCPKGGVTTIDGEDVQKYDSKWLRSQIGYVSQEPVLLDQTIEQNLVYGMHGGGCSQEQIDKALTLANARFILDEKRFPDGLKTRLGRGDDGDEGRKRVKLSGGQIQRIAIARAFIKETKILILDEPTSALDGESESKVQNAIDELMALGDRTVIVIAHRLSTIINCDKIVVMDEGKIVEEGTHKELFAKEGGVYRKLFEFQINSMKKNVSKI